MTDITCLPACAPNVATALPANPPATSVPAAAGSLGIDCTSPMFVKLCDQDRFDTALLCTPGTNLPVVVTTVYSATGVPTSTAYNIDGTAYAGAISGLVSCSGGSTESDAVIWCQTIGQTKSNLVEWVVKNGGVPTGVTYWTDFAGAVIAAPAQNTLQSGACGDNTVEQVYVENGCLSTPACFDFTDIGRGGLSGIIIGGTRYALDLVAGWNVETLTLAVAAAVGVAGNVSQVGEKVCFSFAGQPTVGITLQYGLLAARQDFGEGVRIGGLQNSSAIYKPVGPISIGEYAITTFGDAGLGPNSNAGGLITADASNNPAGRAFIHTSVSGGQVLYFIGPAVPLKPMKVRFSIINTNENVGDVEPQLLVNVSDETGFSPFLNFDTGLIPRTGVWQHFDMMFTPTTPGFDVLELRFYDVSEEGANYAIDNIEFGEGTTLNIIAEPQGASLPVEIIKTVDVSTKAITSTRVFSVDGLTEYIAPYVNGMRLNVGACPKLAVAGVPCTMITEVGYLADPCSVDISLAEKCPVKEVIIEGVSYRVNLPALWRPIDLVNAVNAVVANTLVLLDPNTISSPDRVLNSIQILCGFVDFLEDFGTGPRTDIPNTNYIYASSGVVFDEFYAVTTFGDVDLAPYNNADGTLTADAFGNANGRVMVINSGFLPGEFYRKPVVVQVGQEYSVEFYVANTGGLGSIILPDVTVEIRDSANMLLQSFASGPIPIRSGWVRFDFKYVANQTNNQFVLRNNAGGGNGNDLAIDRISFTKVTRQNFFLTPERRVIPVEIVKEICTPNIIRNISVHSPDGTRQYPLPDPTGLLLAVGDPPINFNPLKKKERTLVRTIEEGCAGGLAVNRWTTVEYEVDVIVVTTTTYVNAAGGITPTAPLGWTLGSCHALATEGLATVTRILTTGAGSIPAGASRVNIRNLGGNNAIVAGETLVAGQAVDLQAYYDPVVNVYKRLPQIDYIANVSASLQIAVVA